MTVTLLELSVVADIDMRTGTPVDKTAWLDGGAAAGSYPGTHLTDSKQRTVILQTLKRVYDLLQSSITLKRRQQKHLP